ncbi:MAG: hypothetical protein HRT61_00795 [Ekhidna sp.]|nr:hypothetical protein [Ekhidna sp.]
MKTTDKVYSAKVLHVLSTLSTDLKREMGNQYHNKNEVSTGIASRSSDILFWIFNAKNHPHKRPSAVGNLYGYLVEKKNNDRYLQNTTQSTIFTPNYFKGAAEFTERYLELLDEIIEF